MLNYFLFLVISFIMLAIGAYGLLSKRNMIRMLLSAEVMFNSALLMLLTLAATAGPIQGGVVALIAIGVSAAEIGVMISVGILFFKTLGEIDVYKLSESEEQKQRGRKK